MTHRNAQMFRDALNGIRLAWREKNFRFDAVFAALTLIASWILHLSPVEWVVVFIAIGIVLTAETFNTALEELCDKFQPEHDPHIGRIKDLAAGAVFISSAAAICIGIIIFFPHIVGALL